MFKTLKVGLKRWTTVLRDAGEYWLDSNAFANAGALAFFTIFSMAPMMIMIVSVVGVFYGQETAQGEIAAKIQAAVGSKAAEAVEEAIARARDQEDGLFATLSGLGAMLIGATTVFGQMQDSLNAIFGVAPKPSRSGVWLLIRKRLTSLTIVLAVGFVMLVSLSLSVVLRVVLQSMQEWIPWHDAAFSALDTGLSLAVAALLFGTIIKTLPDVKLSWRNVLLGSLLTAAMFTVGRVLIALYLSVTATASTYGAAGSLVLLLLWVNYSSLILLYGAAFVRADLEHRGCVVQPESVAVRVQRSIVEDLEGS
ncbi:YihY/virulence factor BrkB family protein [Congregibacter litoralis]|uniref:Putative membrane protein n=1 Tax=Congregibacter litoralis KT71 TaxID=314285 RepID=A4A4U8_9GAMM|nr:YihY/virulence factor BrkB family protein [Congregibacter litoralis]EAQ98819.1 putative membrane protein [Congregibacter litoralis KT71]